jgi:hypothetical protein
MTVSTVYNVQGIKKVALMRFKKNFGHILDLPGSTLNGNAQNQSTYLTITQKLLDQSS